MHKLEKLILESYAEVLREDKKSASLRRLNSCNEESTRKEIR